MSRCVPAMLLVAAMATTLSAQERGVVVDQTGLPLPGARVELRREDVVLRTLTVGPDGSFELSATQPTDVVEVALDGFETVRVAPADAKRIVLPIAHATETTEVVASSLTSAGASMEHLGSTMTAPLAQRLPTVRPRILQSLPLLPAVVRGRDGLLRIGGTRPHESVLWIDGFNVNDPVSGTTSLDLPVESVRGMAVLREPVSAAFGNVIGSAASIETTPGGDELKAGVQGFIPRPRLSGLGPGKIEAFFPRAYVGGRAGQVRYFASTEFNFERVPVPGVTGSSGNPNVGTTGLVSFVRLDIQPSTTRHMITLEGLFAPTTTTSAGLSTLRPAETVPDVEVRDVFGGLTDRLVLTSRDLLTLRFGVVARSTALSANGSGTAILTPEGWQQNWFSAVDVSGVRQSLSANWERSGFNARGSHTVSANVALYHRSMSGSVHDEEIRILDADGRLVRRIEFGTAGALDPAETYHGGGIRDLWDVNNRLQLDLGLRVDGGGAQAAVLGPRFGVRYILDGAGRTTLRGSAGRFVGRIPLSVKAFGQFPARTDTTFDPSTQAVLRALVYVPAVAELPLPRADAFALEIEHRIDPTLELQAAVRQRSSSHLPTVEVPVSGGITSILGTGESRYREMQLAVRKTWTHESQLFLSYVWSSSIGEVNDFGSMFTNLDAPLLEPGTRAATPSEVPHRLRGWATFSLPFQAVVSPAVEWRTGFPYSAVDTYRHFAGPPNSQRFPNYFSVDLTAFKTFDVFKRKMDLGLQFFNVTGHFNPRDVIVVVDSPRYQDYSSSFGITIGGYMQVRW